MKMAEIQKMAKKIGLKSAKLTKTELVQSIQTQEGNFPCFKTAKESCDQVACCWRDDCLTH